MSTKCHKGTELKPTNPKWQAIKYLSRSYGLCWELLKKMESIQRNIQWLHHYHLLTGKDDAIMLKMVMGRECQQILSRLNYLRPIRKGYEDLQEVGIFYTYLSNICFI